MTTTTVYLIEKARKLPSGRRATYYVLRWKSTKGKMQQEAIGKARKSGGPITAAVAEKQRREKEVAIGGGSVPRDKPRKMTLSEFIDFHEEAESFGKRPATLAGWRTAGEHAMSALGDVTLESITPASSGRIRRHLEARGRSMATIRKTLTTLKAMFSNAVRRGLLHRNPLAGEKLGPPPKKDKRIFSPAEVDAMIAMGGAPGEDGQSRPPSLWWQALIRLAYTTGLRKAELLHLRWSDLDRKAGTVRVQPRKAGRYAIGDADVPILAWEPKTKSSERTVAVPPDTAAVLLRLQMAAGGSPYMFLSLRRLGLIEARHGNSPARSDDLINNFTRDFDPIQDAAAKATKAKNWTRGTFHDLRKSFATRAASAGVPMTELKAHLGHSSITTTAEYYTEVEASAAERIRKVFAA